MPIRPQLHALCLASATSLACESSRPGRFINYADTLAKSLHDLLQYYFFSSILFIFFPINSKKFISAFFTLRASRSGCICVVTGHLRWRTTAASPVPRICNKLGSWIIQASVKGYSFWGCLNFTFEKIEIIITKLTFQTRRQECGSGGIGRRVSLRSLWPVNGRVGSSPTFRTIP